MTETNTSSMTSDGENGQRRQKRPASRSLFPRVTIQKVLPLVFAIWEEGQGEQVRTTRAFEKLGRSVNSGASRTLIASANTGYGLIVGNANSTFLGLTPAGIEIASAGSEIERDNFARKAMLANDIITKIYERYLHRPLPSDQVVRDYIRAEFNLSDEDSAACWEVLSENLKDYGLVTIEGNRDVLIPVPSDKTMPNPAPTRNEDLGGRSGSVVTTETPIDSAVPMHAVPQAEFHFNIQIHIPNEASPETYDAIFASLAKNLLQRNG